MRTLSVAGLLVSLLPMALGQTKPGEARRWEHESSDIPVNEHMHFALACCVSRDRHACQRIERTLVS
jgi:hypothetical protein